jgi:hypothetical protein
MASGALSIGAPSIDQPLIGCPFPLFGRGQFRRRSCGQGHAAAHTTLALPPPQLMALVTAPAQAALGASMRQVGALLVIVVAGVLSVYVK